ncbi:hypothetical protein ACQEVB_07390 [Pseudonocardia sp. CA-107938]|uniref:hypothetical protein n=1 Tax=Pseudonocardia sp. CA-107938 TaxID=3240021 RepID=UPI003D901C60
MSSNARRSIRTTAAAAGIAALGIGFAGPALAAPSASDLPEAPALDAPSAPAGDSAVPGLEAFTQAADTAHSGMPALPDAFSFQAPTIDGASIAPAQHPQVDPSYLSTHMPSVESLAVPTEMNAASLPGTDGIANLDGTFNGHNVNNDSPALPSLDTANAFTSLLPQAGMPSL